MNNLQRIVQAAARGSSKDFEEHVQRELLSRISDRIEKCRGPIADSMFNKTNEGTLQEFGKDRPVTRLPNWEGREVNVFSLDRKHGHIVGRTLDGTITRVIKREVSLGATFNGSLVTYGPFYVEVDVGGRTIFALASQDVDRPSNPDRIHVQTWPGIEREAQ